MSDPDILIVDEPIAGLDPSHALDCMQRLWEFAHLGKLVIAARHDLALTARYATRVTAMQDGRINADGLTTEVLNPDRLRAIFAVEAAIHQGSGGRYVDLVGPAR